jgi:hypothetical protein
MHRRDPKLTEFSAELLELVPQLDPQAQELILQLAYDLVTLTENPLFDGLEEPVPDRCLH